MQWARWDPEQRSKLAAVGLKPTTTFDGTGSCTLLRLLLEQRGDLLYERLRRGELLALLDVLLLPKLGLRRARQASVRPSGRFKPGEREIAH